MRKSEAYDILFRIQKEQGIDISEMLNELSTQQYVPQSVVDFLEKASCRTVEGFIGILSKTKQFYKNIVFNTKRDADRYVRAFLSLLIHIEITIEKAPALRSSLCSVFKVEDISRISTRYILHRDNIDEVLECADRLCRIFTEDGSSK